MAKGRLRREGSIATPDEPVAAPETPKATPSQTARESTEGDPERERIAHRAYELYMARGASHGQALDDWLAAERELSEQPGRDERE